MDSCNIPLPAGVPVQIASGKGKARGLGPDNRVGRRTGMVHAVMKT